MVRGRTRAHPEDDLLERIMREEVTDRAATIDYRDVLDPARIQMTLEAADS